MKKMSRFPTGSFCFMCTNAKALATIYICSGQLIPSNVIPCLMAVAVA